MRNWILARFERMRNEKVDTRLEAIESTHAQMKALGGKLDELEIKADLALSDRDH